MIDIHSAAKALGGVIYRRGQILCPGPGHSSRDRSLSVKFSQDGTFAVHSFADDHFAACRDYVKLRLGLQRPSTQSKSAKSRLRRKTQSDERRDESKALWALQIWEASEPPNDLLCTYLSSRHIPIEQTDLMSGRVIRFHPNCRFRRDDGWFIELPAMVALYRDISTDEPRAIHRTALREDGLGKADHPAVGSAKQMLGPIRSSAIKLTSDEDVTSGLHIAEGIESGLTAMLLGLQPVWVMGSAAQISRFPVLAGLESLTVLADHDPAGHSAASDCARKYSLSGKEARVLLPPKEGTDWNDYAAELKGRYV